MIQRKNPLFHHFLQALQSRLCAIIAKHYCFGSIYFWRILFQQKRLFFWFLVYFGKYGPCTIVHIMTQSCKPSYIKLFKAFYSKAPHPMVKKFFKIWWFDMIQLMILDKMRSCLWKVEQGFWVYGLIKLSDPIGRNLVSRLQTPRSRNFLKFDGLIWFILWFWMDWYIFWA